MQNANAQRVGLVLGPALFLLTLLFFRPDGLSDQGIAVLACTLWIALWWITEAIPISATALLPIVLFPLSGALELNDTTASYGHRFVFLYIGGFMLAIAIERWNLHRRIALNIIRVIGTNLSMIILGFMLATAFMSMWISNTATTVMMLPIGIAIVKQFVAGREQDKELGDMFGKALMLAIAYAASIGGMATLIGTPPNLVFAGVVQEFYGIEIGFAQWFMFGFPISVTLLGICWIYLTRIAFPCTKDGRSVNFPGGREHIEKLLGELGKMKYEEKMILLVFVTTAVLWISRSFLQNFIPALDDTIIAVMAGLALFLIPSKDRSRRLITWQEAVQLPWGIMLLFGGGIAIAAGFQQSGLAVWIGSQLTLLEGIAMILMILVIIAAVNFLTEITSNLATTAMLLPILAPMGMALDIHPYALMVSATVAASCAFMLPVATPPNALVFGSGFLKISDMFSKGIWMNLISILLLTLFVYFLLPVLWGIDLSSFPAEFR